MLEINQSQMSALRVSVLSELHNRALDFVNREIPPEYRPKDPTALAESTWRALEVADRQGIKRASYMVGFACLYLIFGPDFRQRRLFVDIWRRPIGVETKIAESYRRIAAVAPTTPDLVKADIEPFEALQDDG